MSPQLVDQTRSVETEIAPNWIGLGVRMTFAADEEIYAQDEDADLYYQVIRGTVRTTRLLSDGRRQVGEFYHAGDVFGFEEGPRHLLAGEAVSDCEILVVRRSAARQFGGGDGRFERQIWAATSRELSRAHNHVLLLGRKTAAEKVAGFLLDIAGRFAGQTTELPMGRQDIADYLGLTIETVSRMLTQMQSDGLVRFDGCRRFSILNRRALMALASD